MAKKKRHHRQKHNALCTAADILDERNFREAVTEELKRTQEREKVERNPGKATKFREYLQSVTLEAFVKEVCEPGYRISSYTTAEIPKGDGRTRRIYMLDDPRDRLLERMIYQTLVPICEKNFSESSYAYRPHRGIAELVKSIEAQARDLNYALKVDITKFFDSLDHNILRENLKKWLHPDNGAERLIELFLNPRYRVKPQGSNCWQINKMSVGVPQGSILAPLFANVYGTAIDRRMETVGKIKYTRYADDILIIAADVESLNMAKASLMEALKEIKLKANPEKIRQERLHELVFLGVRFSEEDSRARIPAERFRMKVQSFMEGSEDKYGRKIEGLLRYYAYLSQEMLDDEEIIKVIMAECGEYAPLVLELVEGIRRRNNNKSRTSDSGVWRNGPATTM